MASSLVPCPKCGAVNSSFSPYCHACGAPLLVGGRSNPREPGVSSGASTGSTKVNPNFHNPNLIEVTRVSENELLVSLDPGRALTAIALALREAKVQAATPDAVRMLVRGSTGFDWRSWGQEVTAAVWTGSLGTHIRITSRAAISMVNLDAGRTRGEARELTESLATFLERSRPESFVPVAPGFSRNPAGFGQAIVWAALIGAFCFPCLPPLAWLAAQMILNQYGDFDPGDRAQVRAGRALAMACTLGSVILFLLGILFAGVVWHWLSDYSSGASASAGL